jgi:hypothetical protein
MGALSQVSLDRPPVQPPNVMGQMGVPAEPAAQLGEQIRQAQQGMQPSQDRANPQGFMLMRAQAIVAVLDEMARASELFAPFANRMKQILDMGVGESLAGGPAAVPRERNLTGSAAPSEQMGPPPNFPG